MSNNSSSAAGGGVSLTFLVFIVFLILKLTHTIDWSWWWVTAPLWIPVGILALVTIILGILKAIIND